MRGGSRWCAWAAPLTALALLSACGRDDAGNDGPATTSAAATQASVTRIVLQVRGDASDKAFATAVEIIRNRLDALGGRASVTAGNGRIEVELEGIDADSTALLIGRQGTVHLRPVLSCTAAVVADTPDTSTTSAPDPAIEVSLPTADGTLTCLVGPAGATGEVFSNDADAVILNGEWMVSVGLRPGADGEGPWNALAASCYSGTPQCPPQQTDPSGHGQLAIVVDGVIVSAPTVNAPVFANEVTISGGFTEREAKDLAKVLKFGAVPIALDVISVEPEG